jgi:SRSO17 transposase
MSARSCHTSRPSAGSSNGRPFGRGGPAVHRHVGKGRQLPDRGVPRLRQQHGPGAGGPGAVSATAWTEDRDRCARAGVPAEVGFATKPQLGVAMLARAHAAGVLAGSWVTADEAYGQNPSFRAWLAERGVPFVLATRNDDVLISPGRAPPPGQGARHHRRKRRRRRVGAALDRARRPPDAGVRLDRDRPRPQRAATGLGHWLLVRRQTRPGEGKQLRDLAFYRCAGPAAPPLRELIRVAGPRWAIEECFQTAKNKAGLDRARPVPGP